MSIRPGRDGRSKTDCDGRSGGTKGKIAGIVLGILVVIVLIAVVLILLHKRKQKKRGIVSAEDQEPGDLETEGAKEKKIDEDVEGVGAGGSGGNPVMTAPTVPGEMSYGSEPASPGHTAGTTAAPFLPPIQTVPHGATNVDK